MDVCASLGREKVSMSHRVHEMHESNPECQFILMRLTDRQPSFPSCRGELAVVAHAIGGPRGSETP